MGLLSKAFLDNLFPRPYQGELKSGLVITYVNQKECLSFFFQDDYYRKLLSHIQNEYDSGRFSRSNAEQEWNDLLITLRNSEEIDRIDNEEELKNYWLSIDKPSQTEDINKMKKINVTKEIQGDGMFSFNDETWREITKIKDGKLLEEETKYTIEYNNGYKLEFPRNQEIILAKMSNRFLPADLKNFEVCELQNSEKGNFLLYRAKKEDIKNSFILASIGGFMGGSSIWFNIE